MQTTGSTGSTLHRMMQSTKVAGQFDILYNQLSCVLAGTYMSGRSETIECISDHRSFKEPQIPGRLFYGSPTSINLWKKSAVRCYELSVLWF